MRGESNQRLWFEVVIFVITVSPFLYLLFDWNEQIAQHAAAVYGYLFTSSLFYFFSIWFTQLDTKRQNKYDLWASAKQIRLIWAFFIAAVGWVLFYHTLHLQSLDFFRLIGVLLALFLFASGNFQVRLHPSSAFSGNRWQLGLPDAGFRRGQRLYAKIKFWAGILATIIFLFAASRQLLVGYLVLIFAVIYGLVFRVLKR